MQDADYKALDARISAVISRVNLLDKRVQICERHMRYYDSLAAIVKRASIGIAAVWEAARRDVQRSNAAQHQQEEFPLGKSD